MTQHPAAFKPGFNDRLQQLFTMPGRVFSVTVAPERIRLPAAAADPLQAELELAQANLRQAIQVGELYLWEVDLETGQRTYENDVARLLGHAGPRPTDEAMFFAAMEPADRAAEGESFVRALNPKGDICRWTCRLNGVDGVQRVVEASGHGLFDDKGAITRFAGVLRDVTESTRQREMVEDRALFAEQMIGIVSHDLRNPLSAILMGTKLLQHGEDDPKRLQTLDRVSTSARRAQRLIADLLDFTLARVGPGLSVKREALDLHGLVFGAVDELQLASPDCVVVHRRVGSGACTADADRIAQLLGNLLHNAMAYGTPGAEITVTSEVGLQAATLSVHNWGPPIPRDLLPTLFEPMVRGRSANASNRSVGLGLFIVRAIALAHGGKVSVESTQDEGTTFSFSFPVL